jgi:lipopolysaccharide/colanic/teichoic acid biosynthesis glycosyltransferase
MYPILKRIFDFVVALIALIILLPVIIPIILLLMLTGEHEVFYFQKRVGYKKKDFYIWKFATMLKNSPNIGSGIITLRNDPRVTRMGKILRITKINELPQVINVLKGDMSLVGPRPLVKKSFELYPEELKNIIYDSRPGITGIGSIIFRDEEKIISEAPDMQSAYYKIYQYKGSLEKWYNEHRGFFTDLLIVFLTAWHVVFPKSNLVYRVFPTLPTKQSGGFN